MSESAPTGEEAEALDPGPDVAEASDSANESQTTSRQKDKQNNNAPPRGNRRKNASQPPQATSRSNRPAVVTRYGLMRQIGLFRHNLDPPPAPGAKVVIRSERGVELGEVIAGVGPDQSQSTITLSHLDGYVRANGPDYPFRRNGKILRLANHQDVIDYRHLHNSAKDETAYCNDQIRQLKLPMKIVSVEHLLGGERIIFCFSAKTRVDFRELVHRLAGQYRTRIEMHQVGARDEARLVADYERCGRPCCCHEFLKNLKPVSMRMAKTQKATLDPTKISGRCGRLMCCLRYEDEGYEYLRKKLPNRNTWVRTSDIVGRVVKTQILTQLVVLELPNGSSKAVANEDIIERNIPAPTKEESSQPQRIQQPRRRSTAAKTPAKTDKPTKTNEPQAKPEPRATVPTHGGKSGSKSRKKHRRRPKRTRGNSAQARTASAKAPAAQSDKPTPSGGGASERTSGGSPDGTSPKTASKAPGNRPTDGKKRRRRRSRKPRQ